MALPTAMFATIAALGLGGAAVMSSVNVQQGSKRDSGSKSAIAAADAGVNVATMRINRDSGDLASGECLDGATPEGGWCPPETGTIGGAEYSYRTSAAAAGCGEFDLCIVSTGTAGEVSRRVLISFESGPGGPGGGSGDPEGEEGGEGGGGGAGGGEGVIGVEEVIIQENADARVGVGSNGDVYVENNGNVCGHIREGVGHGPPFFDNNGTQCSGYGSSEENVTVPSVASFAPSDLASSNSNYRLVKCDSTDNPVGCQSDTYSKSWKSDEPWDAATRTIETGNNATLTLGGGDYFVCKLHLSNNSHLIMAEGAKVRVFFDTPENCGLSDGENQIYISNNANITATGYQPELGEYEMPGFYLFGSTSISTRVEWKNNSGTNELILYAPNSEIVLKNNATFHGVIVGKSVELANNAIVEHHGGFELPDHLDPWHEDGSESEGGSEEEEEPDVPPTFTPQHYVECTGPAGATPDSSC